MSETSFFLNFEPDIPTLTHQVGIRAGINKRKGTAYVYKDGCLRALEAAYDAKLAQFVPQKPFGDNTELRTMWVFSSDCNEPHYRNEKPDTDNLIKTFKDRMSKLGFFTDDKCVVREMTEKINAPEHYKHGIYVWIRTLDTLPGTATPASTGRETRSRG